MDDAPVYESERFAVYLAPPPEHRLTERAAAWLGRNAWTGEAIPQPDIASVHPDRFFQATAAPRHYGFHATLRAPFELRPEKSVDALKQAIAEFTAEYSAFELPLRVAALGPFLALRTDAAQIVLSLEQAVLAAFEPFRAPLSGADRTRRLKAPLTDRQKASLDAWGYPYVGEDFHFHMTLTGPLSPDEAGAFEQAAKSWFDDLLSAPQQDLGLALFHQPDRKSAFKAEAFYSFA